MQALLRGALVAILVALVQIPDAVRCASISEILEDTIQRTNRIVDRTERTVIADLDNTQNNIRRRTLNTRITDDIDSVSDANKRDTDAFARRTLQRIAAAEAAFGRIYGYAKSLILNQSAGSLQESVVRSAVRRIDAIVSRCIRRINAIAMRARGSIQAQAQRSADYLSQLHDRAVQSDPEEQERDQELLTRHVNAVARNVHDTIVGGKNDITRTVLDSEDQVRNEARPEVALANYGRY